HPRRPPQQTPQHPPGQAQSQRASRAPPPPTPGRSQSQQPAQELAQVLLEPRRGILERAVQVDGATATVRPAEVRDVRDRATAPARIRPDLVPLGSERVPGVVRHRPRSATEVPGTGQVGVHPILELVRLRADDRVNLTHRSFRSPRHVRRKPVQLSGTITPGAPPYPLLSSTSSRYDVAYDLCNKPDTTYRRPTRFASNVAAVTVTRSFTRGSYDPTGRWI